MRNYKRFVRAAFIGALVLLLALAGSALAQGAADPVINEFVFNHDGTDTHEFIEIFGSPNTNYSTLTLLELEGDSTGAGVIDGVFPVGTTDGDGIWFTGYFSNGIENGTVTVLLVEGYTGSFGSDLDTDNDGVFDLTPWTRIVDAVAVTDGGSTDRTYASTVLEAGFDGGSFTVGGASRIPDGANTWIRNSFSGEGLPGFSGSVGPNEVANTPDALNGEGGEPPALVDPLINEFVANHTGIDYNEYVEVLGEPNGDYSAFYVLEIEGDSGSTTGFVDDVFQVGTTDAQGFWVVNRSDAIENGSMSLLLVEGFTGAVGTDLDTDDDGVFDVTPWTRLVDSVSVSDGGSSDRAYGQTVLYRGFDGSSFTVGGASRIPNGTDTNAVADWLRNDFDLAGLPGFPGSPVFGEALNTPGATNEAVPEPVAVCGAEDVLIGTIQGSGAASPLVGQSVLVEAVVVGDFQASDELRGFYLQDAAADADGDPATSDGIFVFEYIPTLDVNIGDVVRVKANVAEYFDLTELTGVSSVVVCGTGTVAPTPIALPALSLDVWEAYEGMLVELAQPLTVTDNYTVGRYGEVGLSGNGRLWNPTNVVAPGAAANALQAENDLWRIQLDDGSSRQNRVPPPPYFAPDGTLRAGDTTDSVLGVMSYSFGAYEIHPVQPVIFTRANPRPATPAPVGGELKVASFNVLNYFNGDGLGGGFPTSRGADSSTEFADQRVKIIAAITTLDADVIGLMEIENDGYGPTSAIQDLVNGLNDVVGAGTYAFVDPGVSVIGTDEISVGLIYKPAVVQPVGAAAILDASVDPLFIDDKNRPALIQTFEEVATGARVTVAVNHLKSKGSDCLDVSDPDLSDGQGNCNITRLNAATALVNYLATDPTGSGDPDFLIIGDLNSYALEDPIMAIRAAGYTDLLQAFIGSEAYSYSFQGQFGYLDHALAIENLVSQVSGTTVWHINADEPAALDYNDFNQDVLYQPDQYRSSDHDPVLVGMLLDIELPLDVKPGNSVDPVNLGSNGKLPVAIYGTPQVDVTQIAPESILLAGAPIAQTGKGYLVQYRDVNGDGITDLFAHFETAQIAYPTDGGTLSFEALYNGRRVYGSDDIRLVPVSGMTCVFAFDTWAAAFGPEGPQAVFLHDRTVAQVMEVRGNGHRWYNLAQAYITTRLLEADGVDVSAVMATLNDAETNLTQVSPDGGMKRNDRMVFEDLAVVLSAFNTEAGCTAR